MEKIVIQKNTKSFYESYFKILFSDTATKLSEMDYKLLGLTAKYNRFDSKFFAALLSTTQQSINNYKGELKEKNLITKQGKEYKLNPNIINKELLDTDKYVLTIEYGKKEKGNTSTWDT